MFELVLFTLRPDGKMPQVGDADDGRLFILSDYGNWNRRDFRYLLFVGAVLFKREDMKVHAGGFSEEAFWLLGPSGMDVFAALDDDSRDLKSKAFRDSGLCLMRAGDKYLLACCGEVGTAGIGNHKHNDLLSFELYAGDKAFIVDPGTYVYTRNPGWRNVFRSTRYHNTVVIDGHEQNRFEADKLFEMTADSSVIMHDWVNTSEKDWLDVEHTGYARLAQPVRHRRTFLFEKRTGTWTITDLLTGAGEHTADWYFHFDHGIELQPVDDRTFRTYSEGTNLTLTIHAEIPLVFRIEDGWVSRHYGQKLPAKNLHGHATFRGRCRVVTRIRTDQRFKRTVSEFSICELA
jgi:Heparinase II/III-like protein